MNKARLALLPFSVLYDGLTKIKNYLYDAHLLVSSKFSIPVIVIGNLSVGGTGKTPHTEWVARALQPHFKTAILSRGYGRKTKGYFLADQHSTSAQIGDEPLQIFRSIPTISVAVCEDRSTGVRTLMQSIHPEVVVLDDAFQHRKIQGTLYILLTTYSQPFYNDWVLPAGNLRESASNKKRANYIIVTKCPKNMNDSERELIQRKIKPSENQRVFFTAIDYLQPNCLTSSIAWPFPKKIVLITGIVNPEPLLDHLLKEGYEVKLSAFPDHYDYTSKDVDKIVKMGSDWDTDVVFATTGKDGVKLQPHFQKMDIPLFEFPISITFLFHQEKEFHEYLINHVRKV